MTPTNILFVIFLIVTGIYFVSQSIVFLKDLRFYRSAHWDLSLDSGNKMFLLGSVRRSVFFRNYRVGFLRLFVGIQLFAFGLILFGTIGVILVLWLIKVFIGG